MPSRIEDYAMIGDCHTAALVGKDGSIDWLCFPRFDSAACFAALLGDRKNGRWQIAPAGKVTSVKRRYRDDTLVLETEYTTDEGVVRVIDFMPVRDKVADLVRIVEGVRGRVRMKMDLVIRYDYGSILPWVHRLADANGIRATAGPDSIYLHTPVKLHGKEWATVAEFEVDEGERVPFSLIWNATHEPAPALQDPFETLSRTVQWWREWSSRCDYKGPYRDAVLRSLITLKAMTYAPSGGIAAAVTTSLPEFLGGNRNWDYRFCWLRDATFALMALHVGGYSDEALAWRRWLENAVAGDPQDMQIMYSLTGHRRLPEWTVDWLAGYEKSKPVRVGNAAYKQRQIDVYGEVMDALYQARKLGIDGDGETWHIQLGLLRRLESDWKLPDQGIWETRGAPRHFVYSKVMAWVAFDRAIKTVESFDETGDVDRWRAIRQQIHDEVCKKGFDPKVNSFVTAYDLHEPDASLLLLGHVGFIPFNDPRMRGTVEWIQKTLMKGGFLLRNRNHPDVDGLAPGEGTFLLCSFWLASSLAMIGDKDGSRELFERLLALTNDVGLLSEEYDPTSGRMLGNFPQAFSHIGLILAAWNLSGRGDAPCKQRMDGINATSCD